MSAISADTFKELVRQIRNSGFQVGTVAQAKGQPDEFIAITFDDGYDDLMSIETYLVSEKIPIMVFIPTVFIGQENRWDNFLNAGKRRHLSQSEIKRLSIAGVRFGSHTHTHCDLTALNVDEIEKELTDSKQILESITGTPAEYLAYPFGKYDQRVVGIAQKVGYRMGLTSMPQRSDSFNVGRIALGRLDSSLTIRAKLRPGLLSGAEYLKSLIINRLSRLTPISLRFTSRPISR